MPGPCACQSVGRVKCRGSLVYTLSLAPRNTPSPMSLVSNAGTVDLQELCDMLTRSWPEAGSTPSASTVGSDAHGDGLLSPGGGPACTLPELSETVLQSCPIIHLPPLPLPWDDGVPAGLASTDDAKPPPFSTRLPVPSAYAFNMPQITYNMGGAAEHEDDQGDADEKPRARFSDEAMRVLATCEKLLGDQAGGRIAFSDRESVLREIATLKKRFGRREARPSSPTRSSIMRHRRYSLGVDARRVLKNWVDRNIEDPYPSVQEKIQLAEEAGLTMKQVNDWFTNFRKRHWEGEMNESRRGDCD
jgi:hypothetical protein